MNLSTQLSTLHQGFTPLSTVQSLLETTKAIIQSIYPNTESVSVVGGEELDPPQFGQVVISIKPKNGDFISDFDKEQIAIKLKNYAISGVNQQIVDLKVSVC